MGISCKYAIVVEVLEFSNFTAQQHAVHYNMYSIRFHSIHESTLTWHKIIYVISFIILCLSHQRDKKNQKWTHEWVSEWVIKKNGNGISISNSNEEKSAQ